MNEPTPALLKVYVALCHKSKRALPEQLKLARFMIRVFLFLMIGAMCYAATYNLNIADLITIGIPTAMIIFLVQVFYHVERNTKKVWEKLTLIMTDDSNHD